MDINQINSLNKLKIENENISLFISKLNRSRVKKIIVPICEDLAYFEGNIINTNECDVYLGCDYFLRTTNHRAMEILNSRKLKLESLIVQETKKEQQVIPMQPSLKTTENNSKENISNNTNLKKLDDDTFEIVENFTEEQNTSMSVQGVVENNKTDTYPKLMGSSIIQNNIYDCLHVRQPKEILESLMKKNKKKDINEEVEFSTSQISEGKKVRSLFYETSDFEQ